MLSAPLSLAAPPSPVLQHPSLRSDLLLRPGAVPDGRNRHREAISTLRVSRPAERYRIPSLSQDIDSIPSELPGVGDDGALSMCDDVGPSPPVFKSPVLPQLVAPPIALCDPRPSTLTEPPFRQQPLYDVSELRRDRGDFSLFVQIDGLLHKLLGLRLERDALASSRLSSVCMFSGASIFESLGSFCGLFYGPDSAVLRSMTIARLHHACGVFVLSNAAAAKLDTPAILTFSLPSIDSTAIFLAFDYKGRFKSKRRPERSFVIKSVPRLRSDADVIGGVPVVLTMCSPLAGAPDDLRANDAAPGSAPVAYMDPPPSFPCPPSPWNVAKFREFSRDFPDPMVAAIARSAVSKNGFDPAFRGLRDRQIIRKNSPSIRGKEALIRAKLMEEVAKGRTAGPFPLLPFQFGRTVPLSTASKDKYDPSSLRFRLISNFSAGGVHSTNDLSWSPRLLQLALEAQHLRLELALAGPGARLWASDVECAFRHQRNSPSVLWYMIYALTTPGFGREFFVELCNAFGWRPSEFVWQCILAVLMWELRRRNLQHVLSYVDNFFRVFTSSEDWLSEVASVEDVLAGVGLPLHESQFGAPAHELASISESLESKGSLTPDVSVSSSVKALGWLWMLDGQSRFMVCPEDKFLFYNSLLSLWTARSPLVLSLGECEKAAGIMFWVSAGFTIGRSDVGALVNFRSELGRIAARENLSKSAVRKRAPPQVKEALQFWLRRFSTWDRRCPIFAPFSPVTWWERWGKFDSCTDWGCGGLLFDGVRLFAFAHEWTGEERARAFVLSRESTGFLELLGGKFWFELFGDRCSACRLLLESDSASSVQGITAGFSKKPYLFELIRNIRFSCAIHFIDLRMRFIVGAIFNQISDLLSHGKVLEAQCRARLEFGLEFVLLH